MYMNGCLDVCLGDCLKREGKLGTDLGVDN